MNNHYISKFSIYTWDQELICSDLTLVQAVAIAKYANCIIKFNGFFALNEVVL